MQLVQELCEQDISTFLGQASETWTLEERLKALTEFALQNGQYYYQQLLLWVDFAQQTRDASGKEIHFLQQVWERTRKALADYLQTSDPALVDFVLIFMDGLFMQSIYGRGIQDMAWFQEQSQLMIQMVIHHEQNSSQLQN